MTALRINRHKLKELVKERYFEPMGELPGSMTCDEAVRRIDDLDDPEVITYILWTVLSHLHIEDAMDIIEY